MALSTQLLGHWSRLKRKMGLSAQGISPNAPDSYERTCEYFGWVCLSYPSFRDRTPQEVCADLRWGVTHSKLPKPGDNPAPVLSQIQALLDEAERAFATQGNRSGQKGIFRMGFQEGSEQAIAELEAEPAHAALKKASRLYYDFGYLDKFKPAQDTM